jgi:hypothetical protein
MFRNESLKNFERPYAPSTPAHLSVPLKGEDGGAMTGVNLPLVTKITFAHARSS